MYIYIYIFNIAKLLKKTFFECLGSWNKIKLSSVKSILTLFQNYSSDWYITEILSHVIVKNNFQNIIGNSLWFCFDF